MLALTLALLFFLAVAASALLTHDSDIVSVAPAVAAEQPAYRYRGHTASEWAARFRQRTRQLQQARAAVRQQWRPTVTYALRLASIVYGVSYAAMSAVAWCESHHYPYARNGQYRGLFQEGPMFERGPFGSFSVFDPVANALTAGYTVAREGWRQWECQP